MDEGGPQGNSEWLKEYHLELRDFIACDSSDCTNEATMYTQVSCCGSVSFGCVPCMNKTIEMLNRLMITHHQILCDSCGARCAPGGWLTQPRNLSLTH